MKTNARSQVLVALLTVVALLGLRALHNASGVGADSQTSPARPAQVVTGVAGEYTGRINISDVVAGRYTDALATVTPVPSATRPPGTLTPAPASPKYGGKVEFELDLVLYLQTNGCQAPATLCGYVVLDRTLGFHTLAYPQVAVIQATPIAVTPLPGQPTPAAQAVAIGPRVSGTFEGTTLTLASEVFTQVQAEGRTIPTPPVGPQSASYRAPEQKVERQFQFVGTVSDNGKTLAGEYRETMTRLVDGLRGQPATAIGQVTLSQPVFGATPAPTGTPGPSPTSTIHPPSPTPTRASDANRLYLPALVRNSSLGR